MSDKKPTQAMPSDGRKGAPDGVNTQAAVDATGGSDAGAPYPNPDSGKGPKSEMNGFTAHGGQSEIGYHGSGQLGKQKVKPGGNRNSATKGS